GIQQTKTITARRDLEKRLNGAVHQKLIAEDAIQIEQVEYQVACLRIEDLVIESERNIELREAGEAETSGFIAGVKLVEQAIEAEEALVSILRGEIHAVIVIPERA